MLHMCYMLHSTFTTCEVLILSAIDTMPVLAQ